MQEAILHVNKLVYVIAWVAVKFGMNTTSAECFIGTVMDFIITN